MKKVLLSLISVMSLNSMDTAECHMRSLSTLEEFFVPKDMQQCWKLLPKDIDESVASVCEKQIQLWEEYKTISSNEPYPIVSLCFNREGTEIAIGRSDLCCVRSIVNDSPMTLYRSGQVGTVQYNDQGTLIAVETTNTEGGEIFLLNTVDILKSTKHSFSTAEVNALCFGEKDAQLAIALNSRLFKLDIATGTVSYVMDYQSTINSVASNKQGTCVAIATHAGEIFVCDTKTERLVTTIEHGRSIQSVYFNEQGTQIVTTSLNDVCIWDVATGEKLLQIEHATAVTVVYASFNKEGDQLIIGLSDGTVCLWDTITGRRLGSIPGCGTCISMCLHSNKTTKIARGTDKGIVHILERYNNYTLPQILLCRLLHTWILLEKPDQSVDSVPLLLSMVADKITPSEELEMSDREIELSVKKSEFNEVWNSFPQDMQDLLWFKINTVIQLYGKNV